MSSVTNSDIKIPETKFYSNKALERLNSSTILCYSITNSYSRFQEGINVSNSAQDNASIRGSYNVVTSSHNDVTTWQAPENRSNFIDVLMSF